MTDEEYRLCLDRRLSLKNRQQLVGTFLKMSKVKKGTNDEDETI